MRQEALSLYCPPVKETKQETISIGQSSLARSLVSSWLGLALGILIGLFISPLVVHSLDKEFYGYWTVILSICSQMMMLDLGIRSAIVKYISEIHALQGHAGQAARLLSSAAALLLILAILGLLILLTVGFYLPEIIPIPEQSLSLVQLVFVIMALEAAIELAFGIFDATLAANERYDLINATNSIRIFIQAVLLLIFLQNGAGILAVGLIAFCTRLLQRLLTAYLCYRVQPDLQLKPALIERNALKKLAHFGGWAALITICSRIIYQVDTLVVGFLLGPVAVAYYAVPLIVIEMYRSLSQSTSTILTPRFSALHSLNRSAELEQILFRWTSFASLLSVLLGTPLLIFGADFLGLWMGTEFRDSSVILSLLSFPFFLVFPAMGVGQLF